MLRLIALALVLCVLWPLPSHAAQYGNRDANGASDQQAPQRRDPEKRTGQRQADRGDGSRSDELTPDERRELRRDLQRANREIYRKGRRWSRNR